MLGRTRGGLFGAALAALSAACGVSDSNPAADAGGSVPPGDAATDVQASSDGSAPPPPGMVDAAPEAAPGHDAGGDGSANAPDGGPSPDGGQTYDQLVLGDGPVGFWDVSHTTGTEPDLTGKGNDGTYVGTQTAASTTPNGDAVAVFDGATQYVSIPSSASFSIPTTKNLTWEAWIRPHVLQFSKASTDGYVDWMGKCDQYSPTCEWEARMYSTTNPQMRCNRLSAYVFNPDAGLGSAADFQPTCGLFQAGGWHHVVGEYTTASEPATCTNTAMYPGSINIWVDGVAWDQAVHDPTGCMSQYNVVPAANGSTVQIGTMATDTWFQGAIGKVAIYDYLLGAAQIGSHYTKMTGKAPNGSCGVTCTLN
jgi:hypothetical protein